MLFEQIAAEIERTTAEALSQIGGNYVVDRVTVIRGYVQLIASDTESNDDWRKLADVILDVSHIAIRHQKSELAHDLKALAAAIETNK